MNETIFKNNSKNLEYDLVLISPVCGDYNLAPLMLDVFEAASKETSLNVGYLVVEMSRNPEHSRFCKKNNIDYIYISVDEDDEFNQKECIKEAVGSKISADRYCILNTRGFYYKDSFKLLEGHLQSENLFFSSRKFLCNFELTIGLIKGDVKPGDIDDSVYGIEQVDTGEDYFKSFTLISPIKTQIEKALSSEEDFFKSIFDSCEVVGKFDTYEFNIE